MMLFHVLNLCGVCCIGVHDTSQVESSPSREASEHCRLWSWGLFLTLVHLFHEKTIGGN